MSSRQTDRRIAAARRIVEELAGALNLDAKVQLWDGSVLPLGRDVKSGFTIKIAGPGVIGSLIRRPGLDTVIRQYALGLIDFDGGALLDFGAGLGQKRTRAKLKTVRAGRLLRSLAAFVFAPGERPATRHAYPGGGDPKSPGRDNKSFIQFHYDVGNAFYALFLDAEMQYSCAYFTDWDNDLARAQRDKLEMICRKLRLRPGETLLDIGCGWGGLVCHAAQHHGVMAHGITLSQEQLIYARDKIARLGLGDRVTVELTDYADLDGRYDKIASIGMYEHIGLDNIPLYMGKVHALLAPDGLFLNHAISRRAKRSRRAFRRLRPEQRALAKYIFPGGELDHIGHTIEAMERQGFEVQDVEAWRMHYARTTKLWHDRLIARQMDAIAEVGREKYRLWIVYLAGVSLAFSRGTARIYQTLASRSAKGAPPLPPTRGDLYR